MFLHGGDFFIYSWIVLPQPIPQSISRSSQLPAPFTQGGLFVAGDPSTALGMTQTEEGVVGGYGIRPYNDKMAKEQAPSGVCFLLYILHFYIQLL